VDKIMVDLINNTALIRFNPSRIKLGEITSQIEGLGYSVKDMKGADIKGSGSIAKESKDTTLMQGIAYGLIPHIGCIAFIIGSVLGATVLMGFFRPLLMNRYFFHILIAISIGFATLSSAVYLRKNGLLSAAGARRKWQYLSTMYGSTIGINLILFFLIFPMLANVATLPSVAAAGAAAPPGGYSTIKLQVDIPCPGHAPLISEALKSVSGVAGVQFSYPNIFEVSYDASKTNKDAMLSQDVFKEYPATVVSQSASEPAIVQTAPLPGAGAKSSSGAGGCCGGGATCGGSSGGGCGCGGSLNK
jgi:copper chaperone CopZ